LGECYSLSERQEKEEQMARITVTIEGEWEEVRNVLASLTERPSPEGRGKERREGPPVAGPEEVVEGREWTEGQVRRLWRRLSDDARRVLKEVARHPEGIGWQALQQALGMRARQVGGTLSSVGHRMRGFAGLPRPIEKVTLPEGPGYRVHPSVARVIATLEP
jgi:hypothetical protein